MKYKSFALSGVAAIALAGAIAFAPAANAAGASTAQATSPSATSPSSTAPSATDQGYGASSSTGIGTGTTGTADATAAQGQPLDAVSNPKKTLKSASVQASDGQSIGKVTSVHVDSSGKPDHLNVRVNASVTGSSAKTVQIAASKLSYDSSQKMVVAQLTPDEIKSMATGGSSSSSSGASGMSSSPSGTTGSTTPGSTAPSGSQTY